MTTKTQDAPGERIAGPDRAPAELLDVGDVAAMLSCSPRHVYRLSDSGRLPRPIRLGSLVRWRRADIDDWLAEGCPSVRRTRGTG